MLKFKKFQPMMFAILGLCLTPLPLIAAACNLDNKNSTSIQNGASKANENNKHKISQPKPVNNNYNKRTWKDAPNVESLSLDEPQLNWNKLEGLARVWKWIKKIPELMKDANIGTYQDKNRFNKLLVNKYKDIIDFLGYSENYYKGDQKAKNNLFENNPKRIILSNEYLNLYEKVFPNNSFRILERIANDSNRLFNYEYAKNNDDFVLLQFYLPIQLNRILIDIFNNYLNIQIYFLEQFKNSSLSLEQQMKNYGMLKLMINTLISNIKKFINPINHFSLNENMIFTDSVFNGNYEEFYKEMVELIQNEIAPLAIKLGLIRANPLADQVQKDLRLIKQYFLPKIGIQLKVNYTQVEIDKFWNDFKLKNTTKYNWKYFK